MTLFKKNLIWAIAFILLIIMSFLAIILHNSIQKPAKTAQIIQNGKVIKTVDLNTPCEFEITSPDGGYNTVLVEGGKIGITEADCPDKICVRQGFTDSGVLPIVCLPHRLSVVIVADNAEIDAVAGGIT